MQPPHSCKQVAPIEMVPGNAGCDHVGHRQWKRGGGEGYGGGWDEAPHFCRIIKNFLLFCGVGEGARKMEFPILFSAPLHFLFHSAATAVQCN